MTALPLHSASASSGSAHDIDRATAEKLVQFRGQLTLVTDELSPREAMIADLLFLRRALDAAGIDYLLARGEGAARGAVMPILAVAETDRAAVAEALVAACHDEPFYSRAIAARPSTRTRGDRGRPPRMKRRPPLLLSTGSLGGDETSSAYVLYRPRINASGSLRYGARYGIRLEFWDRSAGATILPASTGITRASIPHGEDVPDSVEVFGESWPTLRGMWEPLPRDVTFPIDIVFSWVDGTDLEWQRARAARMQSYVVGEGDDHEARFRQLDELKYALRSVHLFAPWIRDIFIVTDSPRPTWLAEHPRVRVVRSSEFFTDTSMLPTYNSHAVEAQLHHLPGLSEHFLYSNDDMFFGRQIEPETFFTAGGVSRFIEADTRIGLGEPHEDRSGFENAARVNRALLQERFGITIARHLEHAPTPLRRTVLRDLEVQFPDDVERTARSRFRAATDVSVTNSLYHYFALLTGRAVPQDDASVQYIDTTSHEGIGELAELLRKRDRDFFCLNDGSFPELAPEVRADAVRAFLDSYFPVPAPWEIRAD